MCIKFIHKQLNPTQIKHFENSTIEIGSSIETIPIKLNADQVSWGHFERFNKVLQYKKNINMIR